MKKCLVFIVWILLLSLTSTNAQFVSVPLQIQQNNGGTNRLTFGIHPLATYCIDEALGESSVPPPPPSGVFEIRFIDPRGYHAECFDQGLYVDYRHYMDSTQIDTFMLSIQPKSNSYPITLSWQNLNSFFGGPVKLKDGYGLGIINIDMKAQTSYVLNSQIPLLMIIAEEPMLSYLPPIVETLEAYPITSNSAQLRGSVIPVGDSTFVWFEWGTDSSYLNNTQAEYAGSGNIVVKLSQQVTNLTPNTLYHYRIAAHNSYGASYGLDKTFRTDSINIVNTGIKIALQVNNNDNSKKLYFGVYTNATYCIDRELDEMELPPPPPAGTLDVRFIDPRGYNTWCMGQGLVKDFRHYYDTTQIDTYMVSFQPGSGGYPFTFTWDNLSQYYSGPVYLRDILGGIAINIDMKTDSFFTLTNSGITSLLIIAYNPILGPPAPYVYTYPIELITPYSAILHADINPNGYFTEAWFEWGFTENYGNVTPSQFVGSGTEITYIKSFIDSLMQDKKYHYRAVAENINGITYGNDQWFITSDTQYLPIVLTNPATNITLNSATLNGMVIPNELYAIAHFEWGLDTSYGNVTPDVYVYGDFLPEAYFNTDITNLTPFTTYHYRAVASNSFGTSFGGDMTFTTDSVIIPPPFGIPIFVTDSVGNSEVLHFGVHPNATYCIDYELGEMYLPPVPPIGVFDARFIDNHGYDPKCFDQGTRVDVRTLYDSTQSDTFAIKIQPAFNSFLITLRWPNLNDFYYGSVTLRYRYINDWFEDIDMKAVNEFSFGPMLASLNIIATGPKPLTIDTLNKQNSPRIVSVRDVPFDQGGYVTIKWIASTLDTNVNNLTHYSIWRALIECPRCPYTFAESRNIARSTTINGQEYFWEWIANVPAHRFYAYSFTAPTLYNATRSIDGKHYFLVSAHTNDANIFYDSNVDSGFSVDNLPPRPPANVIATILYGGGISIHWNPNTEPDIWRYQIHLSSNSGTTWMLLGIMEDTIYHTIIPYLNEQYRFIVCAQDINENISEFSNEYAIQLTNDQENDGTTPTIFALYQNYPNPFNPVTTIKYQIPNKDQGTFSTYNVKLKIYDMLGQEVAALVNSQKRAGVYTVQWDASSQNSGVYYYRLQAIPTESSQVNSYTETKKLILLR